MQIKVTTQFAEDFKKSNDPSLQEKFKKVLAQLKIAQHPEGIAQCKPMYGNENAYKLGIGFYYLIGIVNASGEFILMRWIKRGQVLEIFREE